VWEEGEGGGRRGWGAFTEVFAHYMGVVWREFAVGGVWDKRKVGMRRKALRAFPRIKGDHA
jgi:hypothetical protein